MKNNYVRDILNNYSDFMRKKGKRKHFEDKHGRKSSQGMFCKIAVDKLFDSVGKIDSLIPKT